MSTEDQSLFVSRVTALLSKQFSIPHDLVWKTTHDLGPSARLEPYLTRVLHDDNGLGLFTFQGCHQIFRFQEVIYHELCWEFFATIHIDMRSMF